MIILSSFNETLAVHESIIFHEILDVLVQFSLIDNI